MMDNNIKQFIEKNIELIETNRFDELYKKAENDLYFSQSIGTLTRTLLKADIDPLPHLTKEIPYCYLYGDSNIVTFKVPDNIEFISSSAFCNCSLLHDVTFGKNVSVVYYGAFEGCSELTDVHLNEGLLEIGQYAFRGTNIEKIRLPKSLRDIDIQAFPDLVTMQVYRDTYGASYAITNGYEVEYLD